MAADTTMMNRRKDMLAKLQKMSTASNEWIRKCDGLMMFPDATASDVYAAIDAMGCFQRNSGRELVWHRFRRCRTLADGTHVVHCTTVARCPDGHVHLGQKPLSSDRIIPIAIYTDGQFPADQKNC